MDLNAICEHCKHKYKFHVDIYGAAQSCDVEIGYLSPLFLCSGEMLADEDPEVLDLLEAEQPIHCKCNQFVRQQELSDIKN